MTTNNSNKHSPDDFECPCDDCMQEQVDRLNEMLIEKAVRDTEQRIINDLKDQFAFVMECETQEGLQIEQNSIYWSERWQLTFNNLIALIKGEK